MGISSEEPATVRSILECLGLSPVAMSARRACFETGLAPVFRAGAAAGWAWDRLSQRLALPHDKERSEGRD